MRDQRGPLPEETIDGADNQRILRFLAKYTVNAARVFGIADHVGSLEAGKLADIVLWKPAFFGVKPSVVIKGGFAAWAAMGDSAASILSADPVILREQWGACGLAPQALSATFVHPSAIDRDLAGHLGLGRRLLPVSGTRRLSKADMLRNDCLPAIAVDSQTFDVHVDGALAWCEPAERLPLAQLYMLR
jgi:urease subunit alpha